MVKRYLEDFEIGDEATSPGRTITETDVYRTIGFGVGGELHHNKEYAENETPFEGRIVGNSLLILLSNYLWGALPGWEFAVVAAYGRDNIRFTAPVYIDDTVHLEAEVIDKRERDEDSGIITIHEELINQDGELTMVGDHLTLIERDG